jgi:hypothetical protein
MTGDFFDRLEADLASLARQGSHLDDLAAVGPDRRRVGALIRRGAAIVGLVVALAASLVGGFPESASGQPLTAQAPATRAL